MCVTLAEGVRDNANQFKLPNNGPNAKQKWDTDFEEIQNLLTEEEQSYVSNTVMTVQEKIEFIRKYLTYRKVEYLHDNEGESQLKAFFKSKISKTQRYIEHLKRENYEQITLV